MLCTEGFVKRFGSIVVVDRVTMHIPAGQMVGIIGRSGAGKTTFLRLIDRLIEPTEGTIHYRDVPISALKGRQLRAWRARCAMIFQQFNLVNRLDVLTNALIGRLSYHWTLPTLMKCFSAAERALAIRALERLDLLPQALQRADTLSGGQQQRVAIARALVQQPQLILADEPIASLDPYNAIRVMTALRAINCEDGITIMRNLHAVDMARSYCDRIIGMAHGKLVFDGPPTALTAGVAQQIYGDDQESEQVFAYAQAWLITGGKVEPIVVEADSEGSVAYYSVIAVKADSPYRSIEDLKGKSLAFADPNSTSAFVAPSYFLREQGIDPGTFFWRTGFSGSHENGIIAVLNGTYDAAATSWTNEERSNVARMELKGMSPKGQIRYIWKSPQIPNGPWAMHADLPMALKSDIRATLVTLPTADPTAWKDITDGKSKGVEEITHADFEPIIRMIKDNQRARHDAKAN